MLNKILDLKYLIKLCYGTPKMLILLKHIAKKELIDPFDKSNVFILSGDLAKDLENLPRNELILLSMAFSEYLETAKNNFEVIQLANLFIEKSRNDKFFTTSIFETLARNVKKGTLILDDNLKKLFYNLLQNIENYLGLERHLGGRQVIESLIGNTSSKDR